MPAKTGIPYNERLIVERSNPGRAKRFRRRTEWRGERFSLPKPLPWLKNASGAASARRHVMWR